MKVKPVNEILQGELQLCLHVVPLVKSSSRWLSERRRKPRCFKNIKPEQLPVSYIAKKKAWMTNDIFLAWIKDVNQETKRKRLHTDVFG